MKGYTSQTAHGLLPVAGLVAALLASTPAIAAERKAAPNAGVGLTARIDHRIDDKLKADGVPASPRADDAEFLRRACLDLAGVIPTAERARDFLDSKEPDKRAKLIDELLASPEYGRHLSDIWQDLLLTRTSDNRRMQPAPFIKWLEESFNANKPWDRFTTELLTASGPQDKSPGVTYFLANNSVDKITDNVARNLLGVQLQCAQCHNHPFTGWKQAEYWGMAAFFMKVRPDNVNRAARTGAMPGVSETPGAVRGRQRLPESAKIVPAKFLQGAEPRLRTIEPYRPVLAEWVTSPKNPYFAKAMVNRVWAQLFGRGIVNPVDDMHDGNPASHPELLRELADGFVASGFDVKGLFRTICNSEAYQRSSKPLKGNEDAEAHLYARAAIKPLSPEQLYDSLSRVAGVRDVNQRPGRVRPGRQQPGGRAQFVAFFRAEEGTDPTEYNAGIPQALRLMNSNQFVPTGLVAAAARSGKKPEDVVEQLYLSTLSRRPTTAETERMMEHVRKRDARDAYGDIAWALMNCSEFALCR